MNKETMNDVAKKIIARNLNNFRYHKDLAHYDIHSVALHAVCVDMINAGINYDDTLRMVLTHMPQVPADEVAQCVQFRKTADANAKKWNRRKYTDPDELEINGAPWG